MTKKDEWEEAAENTRKANQKAISEMAKRYRNEKGERIKKEFKLKKIMNPKISNVQALIEVLNKINNHG